MRILNTKTSLDVMFYAHKRSYQALRNHLKGSQLPFRAKGVCTAGGRGWWRLVVAAQRKSLTKNDVFGKQAATTKEQKWLLQENIQNLYKHVGKSIHQNKNNCETTWKPNVCYRKAADKQS